VDIDLSDSLPPDDDLNSIKVAPSPYRLSSGANLRFINLTGRAEIQIYTVSGVPVRTLYHTDGTGSLEWDVRNDEGSVLASGVYIYYVESYKQDEAGKFSAIGKFAVIK
jgi:hypothetical protein